MIERILNHMNIYRAMKNAAIPLKLIGKKGEDSCMNAARLVNQQELSGLMEGLSCMPLRNGRNISWNFCERMETGL